MNYKEKEEKLDKIKELMLNHSNPSITIYPKSGEVHIHVTAKGFDENECERLNKPVIKELKTLIGEYIYTSEDEVSLEQSVVDLLKSNNLTISCAESCTGGLLSSRMTDLSGSSSYIMQNFVTYANRAKVSLLGVRNETIKQYGVVSEEVAKEMAEGLFNAYECDIAVSVTGIAGPTGGSKEKPVGLAYASIFDGKTIKTYKIKKPSNLSRRFMKYAFSNDILDYLIEYLK